MTALLATLIGAVLSPISSPGRSPRPVAVLVIERLEMLRDHCAADLRRPHAMAEGDLTSDGHPSPR